MRWFLIAFASVIRSILALRYRIEVRDGTNSRKDWRGVLFLSNHQSQIDTVFIGTVLGQKGVRFRPLIVEYVYRMAWLKLGIKALRAIPIPNFESSVNQYKKVRGERALQEVSRSLTEGQNVLLFPSGKMKRSGVEKLGGASAAYNLVQEHRDMPVVLIRITGLWGSRFSRALSEELPIAEQTILAGIRATLKNLLFFNPRRRLHLEIMEAPQALYEAKEKLEFNRILEDVYNRYPDAKGAIFPEEPLQIVPLSRWENASSQIAREAKDASSHFHPISEATQTHVYREIGKILGDPSLKIRPEMQLSIDLGMDSLDIAELMIFLARHSKADPSALLELETVQDALEVAEGYTRKGVRHFSQHTWPKEGPRPPIVDLTAKHIVGAIFETCQRLGSRAMCGDDRVGVLSYRKFWRVVRVLAAHFSSWPDRYVAVMLPASVGTYVVVLALQLAQKVPVMLNWTLGSRYLEHMVELSQAKRILSSWAFIDRLHHVDFGKLVDQIEFLEDIRSSLSLKEKWRGLFGHFDLDAICEDDEAVILFTSGSEAMPKGVPLTHRNIMANFYSTHEAFPLHAEDIAYSLLPPFHSFGMVVTAFFCLMVGVRTAFYPDPTDAVGIAEGIRRWRVTHVGLAPTFLKALLKTAHLDSLATVEIIMTGGEKTPAELLEKTKEQCPQAHVIEGYGVTECSPCISLDLPHPLHQGVGRILPNVEILVVHPETHASLPRGSTGEICVSGDNVFKGYLGHLASPFLEREGKRWYRTGDMGFVGDNRILYLSGRLKRFVKMGAEMVSLTAIEEALKPEIHRLIQDTDTPVFAVCPEEKEGEKPRLILFTRVSLTKETANQILHKAGLSTLIKLDRVEVIDEIPLFASGKINYRQLMGK